MFEIPAAILSWFYDLTNSYMIAIALMSVVIMAITTPLTLKSTKGMLEMQKISPEMRRLQNEHRNDKQKLNEEMMKLYFPLIFVCTMVHSSNAYRAERKRLCPDLTVRKKAKVSATFTVSCMYLFWLLCTTLD